MCSRRASPSRPARFVRENPLILRPRENPKTSHPRNAAHIRIDSPADFRVLTWTEYISESHSPVTAKLCKMAIRRVSASAVSRRFAHLAPEAGLSAVLGVGWETTDFASPMAATVIGGWNTEGWDIAPKVQGAAWLKKATGICSPRASHCHDFDMGRGRTNGRGFGRSFHVRDQ